MSVSRRLFLCVATRAVFPRGHPNLALEGLEKDGAVAVPARLGDLARRELGFKEQLLGVGDAPLGEIPHGRGARVPLEEVGKIVLTDVQLLTHTCSMDSTEAKFLLR